jgi:hypothetical protein
LLIEAWVLTLQMVKSTQITRNLNELTPEGSQIAAEGSHEYRVWKATPVKGQGEPITVPQLKVGSEGHEKGSWLTVDRALSATRRLKSVRAVLSRTSGLLRMELALCAL